VALAPCEFSWEEAVSARRRISSKNWDTFLIIPTPNTTDEASVADADWLSARGVEPGSPVVLQLLRKQVLPLIRWLEDRHGLDWYFFLVHDRASGVPTTEKDKNPYIHLRLVFKKPMRSLLELLHQRAPRFEMTMPVTDGDKIAGIDEEILRGNIHDARRLIGQQSEWVLDLLEAHERDADPLVLVKQVRQFGHYFSNMLQMKFV
jgi:hypothetical protein